MLGADITGMTAPLDVVFESLTVPKIAVGDGGNEIGMARLDPKLVEATVKSGSSIRCVVDCDHLVVGGTSNWGAYALAALVTARAGLDPTVLREATSLAIIDSVVAAGGVDGVTAMNVQTVDGLSWDRYWSVPARIRRLLF